MTEHTSEIASLRQRIELEEAAAVWGLYGPAIVASHESITARMERAAEHILHLVEAGKHEEAFALMNMPAWGVEERSVDVGDATDESYFGSFQPVLLDFPRAELDVLCRFLLDALCLGLLPLLDFVRFWSIASPEVLLSTGRIWYTGPSPGTMPYRTPACGFRQAQRYPRSPCAGAGRLPKEADETPA